MDFLVAIQLDSSFKSTSKPKYRSEPIQFYDGNNINFKKENTLELSPKKRHERDVKNRSEGWNNFLLFLLIIFVALIAFGVIAVYLSSTATGQIILVVIIIALIIAGLIAAIAYNDTIFFDILEMLFLFI